MSQAKDRKRQACVRQVISLFLSFKFNVDIIHTIGESSAKLYFYTQTLLSTVAELRIVKDESDSDEDESDAWQQ